MSDKYVYHQLKLKQSYGKKLEALRKANTRPSLANMNEVLIDQAYRQLTPKDKVPGLD